MPSEPCQTCGELTSRWCGTKPCCWECHIAQYPTHTRRGRPGRARPDHGGDQYDLCCIRCGATWVGKAYESCDWCEWETERPQPRPTTVEFVPGVLECDRCGAIRRTDPNWYELTVHGAAEVDAGHPELRSCNGWMRRIPVNRAAHILREGAA